MSKVFIAICVTLSLVAATAAQTATDLAKKYPHHEVYEVQPGVQMAAKFASNGLVCEMQIERTHFSKDGVDVGWDKTFSDDLIDQLVPPPERGEEDTYPGHNMIIGLGQMEERINSYTNVTIDVTSSRFATVIVISWRHRTCQP